MKFFQVPVNSQKFPKNQKKTWDYSNNKLANNAFSYFGSAVHNYVTKELSDWEIPNFQCPMKFF